jgi:hypothetical protein
MGSILAEINKFRTFVKNIIEKDNNDQKKKSCLLDTNRQDFIKTKT